MAIPGQILEIARQMVEKGTLDVYFLVLKQHGKEHLIEEIKAHPEIQEMLEEKEKQSFKRKAAAEMARKAAERHAAESERTKEAEKAFKEVRRGRRGMKK